MSELTNNITHMETITTSNIIPSVEELLQQIAILQKQIQDFKSSPPPPPPPPSQPAPSSTAPTVSQPLHSETFIKVAPPDTFSGSSEQTETFLNQLTLYFEGVMSMPQQPQLHTLSINSTHLIYNSALLILFSTHPLWNSI
ncbi:hypothetical protein BDQ12DRAFT_683105 [Crucibulum laeve]|uniref:Uncharacterized protein n=1 Tax=Crucibulum laeve TaxID=68775 RepID=A0A5C3MBX6_9AGAR|nr:hypothetical protein BDQ12DRAFT_683105 [Crucibulum laeve]